MIGDGINDAPALATSDVSFAIGTATEIAMEAANITLVKGYISKAWEALKLSKQTMNIIKRENRTMGSVRREVPNGVLPLLDMG